MKNHKLIFVSVFAIISIVFLFFAFLSTQNVKPPRPIQYRYESSPIDENDLWDAVNAWRTKSGYEIYKKDNFLCKYAKIRSEEIQIDNSHNGYMKYVKESGKGLFATNFYQVGENISSGITDEETLLKKWLDSPLHRKNLEKDFIYSCISCDNNYCVQLFAK